MSPITWSPWAAEPPGEATYVSAGPSPPPSKPPSCSPPSSLRASSSAERSAVYCLLVRRGSVSGRRKMLEQVATKESRPTARQGSRYGLQTAWAVLCAD